MTVAVTINGELTSIADDLTLTDLVAARGVGGPHSRGRGVAVAVNGEVVPRSRWDDTRLAAEDVIEILSAVGGG